MLCQNCKKNQANTHIKQVINGKSTEMNLCHECAVKMGFANKMSSFEDMLDIGSMMSGLFGMPAKPAALAREETCPGCGATFSQISKSGKAGCAKCYTTFYDRLLPSIKRIHGNTVHTGKKLRTARLGSGSVDTTEKQNPGDTLESLSQQLSRAVKEQNFELAAELRDKINSMKNTRGESNNG